MVKLSSMIGANVGRVEGTEKVNGSAVYGPTCTLPIL